MTQKQKTVIVTGGAGFIGSAVIRELLENTDYHVVNVDCLTYAGNPATLRQFESQDRYQFEQLDIRRADLMDDLMTRVDADSVMHLAAESHVDRSIDGPADFISTNIVGTYCLLEAFRQHYITCDVDRQKSMMFHHISTDEVFGSLGAEGLFTEQSPYQPNSPYSASKASSDHLVRAWGETYKLPTVVSNCSNNYGPFQYPEKLIPVVIARALAGEPIPVYGKGDNVRDWLFVDDHARALVRVMTHGLSGETYNVGGNEERSNLDVVHVICNILDTLRPGASNRPYKEQIEFVTDRPGHDFRYAIDASKIKDELDWVPAETFESGMEKTITWYLERQDWVNEVKGETYQGQRLGLGDKL